jgi:hypothetical protein
MGPASLAAESGGNDLRRNTAEPAAWQGPALTAQLVPPAGRDTITPGTTAPSTNSSPTTPAPAEIVTPSSTPKQAESPLLDGRLPAEELIPPVVTEGNCDEGNGGHHAVQPYGGGHPTDWPWGCGGWPYATGPGLCDNYRIGPRWHVTVDGLVLHRDSTDLVALASAMPASFTGPNVPSGIPNGVDPDFEQFGYGPGGRITFTSQVGNCTGYDVQAAYEGINNWNASIVFPKQPLTPIFYTPGIPQTTTTTSSTNTTVTAVTGTPPNTTTTTTTNNTNTSSTGITYPLNPPLPLQPPAPFPEGFEQRSLHYRSDINSVELNWLPNHDSEWRPIFGARFIRFDDEISDTLNQEVQTPLPFAGGSATLGQFLGVSETDRLNLFHLENNLMGFQVGLLHDTMQVNNRLSIEGFVNGGVYYNQVKYSNVMVVQTTQVLADDTNTLPATANEARTDKSTIVNNDARDMSEISYEAEASITGVCRLNKCWALRAGYQVMWIDHLHLADQAYLGNPEGSSDLLLYGWHAGLECRR